MVAKNWSDVGCNRGLRRRASNKMVRSASVRCCNLTRLWRHYVREGTLRPLQAFNRPTHTSHAAHRRLLGDRRGTSFHRGTCPLCSVGAAWGGHRAELFENLDRKQRRPAAAKKGHYSSSPRNSRNHIVRRQRSPYPLERELPDWLDCDGILDRHQHSGTDQDLTRLGFVA
jgi:hypothetical protein